MDKLVKNVFKVSIKFRDGSTQGFAVNDWRIVGNSLLLHTFDGQGFFATSKMFPLDLVLEMNSVSEEASVS